MSVCWSGAFKCVLAQCKGGKTSEMILENKWKTFETVINFPVENVPKKFTPISDHVVLRETVHAHS